MTQNIETLADGVSVIRSANSWIEGEALQQLQTTAALPGITRAVGMPDLHPGKGIPIGAAFLSEGVIYPHLVGNDIGCGMSLWQSDIPTRKVKLDRFVKRLDGLDDPWNGNTSERLATYGIETDTPELSLGTIGSGNHFAELQRVDDVEDEACFKNLGLDADAVQVLVHSGSRGLGESILRSHVNRHGSAGLQTGSTDFEEYLRAHDAAIIWATANRDLIAERFIRCIGGTAGKKLDLCHNSVTPAEISTDQTWLHRKGAAPASNGPVVIPGSRGSMTYLVKPVGDQSENAWSLAHGAGRRWNRSDSKNRLSRKFRPADLRRTELGGRVICNNKDLLYEEAPQAYKNIEQVILDLVDAGLVTIVARLRPIITYKTQHT